MRQGSDSPPTQEELRARMREMLSHIRRSVTTSVDEPPPAERGRHSAVPEGARS